MELLIKGKNIEVTEEIRKYIEQRLGKLRRHLANITEVEVELAQEQARSSQGRYVVQVSLKHQGTILRGEERAAALSTAIDAVADVISRRVERYKGKLYERRKRVTPLRALSPEPGESGRVVRVKHFPVKPMSVDEAIEQMELLGHDFFLFFNEDVAQFNVVYRRREGDYGLIQPELG
jgi:putative sigma-54 modulation protein